MILLTGTQRDRLLSNGRERDLDHITVVKLFNPFGAGVWLATELDGEGGHHVRPCRYLLSRVPLVELGCAALDPVALRHGKRAGSALHRRFPALGLGRGGARDRQHPGGRARPKTRGPARSRVLRQGDRTSRGYLDRAADPPTEQSSSGEASLASPISASPACLRRTHQTCGNGAKRDPFTVLRPGLYGVPDRLSMFIVS